MSFIPALILTFLYFFSPPEEQQDNPVLPGSVLGPLDKSLFTVFFQPGESHGLP